MLPSLAVLPLDDILKAAEKLPPFPDVVWKVMPLVQQMAPVGQIEEVIKYDQVIAARVLALSRSPHFARRSDSSSLRDAIISLGEKRLIQVILLACSNMYFNGGTSGYHLRDGELWEHAVATALTAELVAPIVRPDKGMAAYTAALLHDIGKCVLRQFMDLYSDTVMTLVREERISFVDAEREALGIDHQELGAIIASRWNFPREILTAIARHHHPANAGDSKDIVQIVYVADRMVSGIGIGCGLDGLLQPNEDEAFVKLGITTPMVDKILARMLHAFKETKCFLSS